MTVWIALWSLDTTGGATRPFTTGSEAKYRASAFAFCRSAAVTPLSRTYTTRAGLRFLDWNRFCSLSSWVDSADDGRYADASFFSAPCSLPARPPSAATTRIQNATTTYFERRPHTNAITRLPPDRGRSGRSPLAPSAPGSPNPGAREFVECCPG